MGLAFAGLFTVRMVVVTAWEFWLAPVVLLAGLAIAWKWSFAGGAVLIGEGVALIATILITSPLPSYAVPMARVVQMLLATFFYGLPFMVTGVLFILSWREGRKALASSASPQGNSRQD